MSHHAPPVTSKPASPLWSAALVLLLAATWLLLVFSGDGAPLRSTFERTPTTAGLTRRGGPPSLSTAEGRLRPPVAPLPVCKLQLDQGPFATNCTALHDLCVDQVGKGTKNAGRDVQCAPCCCRPGGAFCSFRRRAGLVVMCTACRAAGQLTAARQLLHCIAGPHHSLQPKAPAALDQRAAHWRPKAGGRVALKRLSLRLPAGSRHA